MIDPGLVLFAIQAGVKLGRKTYDILVDSTQSAPLVLPLGTLAGSIKDADAIDFFDRKENRPLVEPGGAYHGFTRDHLVAAYHTVRHVATKLGDDAGATGETVATLQALHQFEQHKAGFGPRSPWQRIAGTIVEIGIDYFVANPQAMGKNSAARRTVETFLVGIKDIDFAEGDPLDVVGDTLLAGLQVLGDNTALVSNDARVQVLLGGVTVSLRDDLRAAAVESLGQRQRREVLFKRITASILRGGAAAVAGNVDLFIQGDGKAKAVVRSTLTEMLAGIRDREELFSTESVESLFQTALAVVAANPELFTDEKVLQALLGNTVAALTTGPGGTLFSGASVEAIVRAALTTVGDHAAMLIDPAHPERQIVADTVAAIAHGLAPELAGGATIKHILSAKQLADLTQRVLLLAVRHPERLLGADPRRTAIAQVLGSAASVLAAQNRTGLMNGDTFVQLGVTALGVALKNMDKLLDVNSTDPRTNLLFKTLDALAGAALAGGDTRRLIDRDVFLEMASGVLSVVSADVAPVLQTDGRVVAETVRAVLALSTGSLQNHINGENLPPVVGGLLRAVLSGEVALSDATATARSAAAILRAVA